MGKFLLAAIAGLLLEAGHAVAQPIQGKDFVAVTVVQTRRDQPGDRYSYTIQTHAHTVRKGVAVDADGRDAFNIEILTVDPSAMTVRFTQTTTSETTSGSDRPGQLFSQAMNGVAIDFVGSPNGYPSKVLNEDKVKANLELNFAAISPEAQQQAPRLKQWLDQMPDDKFLALVGRKLTMLTAMQFRGVVKLGHQDLPSQSHQDADGSPVEVKQSLEFGIAPGAACRVSVRRSDWTVRAGGAAAPSSALTTDAVLEEADGWVVELTEVSKTVLPEAQQELTTKINRVSSANCAAR